MIRRAAVFFLLAVVVLLAGTLLAAPWLVETITPRFLAARGLPNVSFDVVDLSPSGATLRDVSADGLAAREVVVLWSPFDMESIRIVIDGLRLSGRWADGGMKFPALEGLETKEAEAPPLALPVAELSVQDAMVDISMPTGDDIRLTSPSLVRTQRDRGIAARGHIACSGPGLNASVDLDIAFGGAGRWQITGTAEATIKADDAELPGIARGISGQAVLRAKAEGQSLIVDIPLPATLSVAAPSPDVIAGLPKELQALLSRGSQLKAEDLDGAGPRLTMTEEDGTLTLGGRGGMSLQTPNGQQRVEMLAEVSVHGQSINDIQTLKIDRFTASGQGIALAEGTVSGTAELTDFVGKPFAGMGHLNVAFALDNLQSQGIAAPRAAISATGQATWDGDTLLLALEKAEITAESPWQMRELRGEKPLTLALTSDSTVAVTPGPEEHVVIVPEVIVTAPKLSGAAGNIDIVVEADRLTVGGTAVLPDKGSNQIEIALQGASGTVAQTPFSSLDGTVRFSPRGVQVHAEVLLPKLPGEPVDLAADAEVLRPFAAKLQARQNDQNIAYDVSLADAQGRDVLDVKGTYDPAAAQASADVTVPPLTFEEDGFQPADIHPALAPLGTRVAGTAAAQGSVRWVDGMLEPEIEVLLKDMQLAQDFVKLQKVNGVILLTNFDPPRTPPGQTIAAAIIDVGIPLTNALVSFALDGQSNIAVESATMELAGGKITAGPATIPLDLSEARIILDVRNMDLAKLVGLTELEGLEAAGNLSGTIPVVLRDGNVVIENATLRADAPGMLRYRPDEPPSALANGGQGVDLMLQALNDFRYKELVVTLNGDAAGDLEAGLHLAGANPALYDGYPLEFNVNVSGALSQILSQSLSGYRVPDRVRERMQEFGLSP